MTAHNHTRARRCNWSCPANPGYRPPQERGPELGAVGLADVLVRCPPGSGWDR